MTEPNDNDRIPSFGTVRFQLCSKDCKTKTGFSI